MRVTLHYEANDANHLAEQLRNHADHFAASGGATKRKRATRASHAASEDAEEADGEEPTEDAEETAPPVAAKGKTGKQAKPVEDEEPAEELAEDDGGFDDSEETDDTGPNFEAVVEGCRAHSKKHGKEKTLAILAKKFKVKSIKDLKTNQYGSVLASLA